MVLLASISLFPPYSLDTSILAAVLLGVIFLALFTETLGWVFVGLVVPGYLASVFVIHPEAGATVVAEAILTYLVAVGLSRGVARTGAWSEFFGRDRFFVIVLASVLVRAVSEVWLLPQVGGWLDQRFGTTFTLERTLHSIGLVLVPLTANAFWKLQLRRGLIQVGVPVALTWALLQFVLLPTTNLSFSSLELTYEDVAQNFLASPKAYILLLTTAFLAARFNLRYGWDFNGILVPALLAVTFVAPVKVVATIVEVLVLVLGTKALLSLPALRTLNLEGPRKTVLVFALGFLLKFVVGWALGGRIPGLKVTDLFGFGYLVPTLLAVKILQKHVIARVVLATAHTSIAGFALGSVIGFGLSLFEPAQLAQATPEPIAQAQSTLGLARSPLGVMALARATVREAETDTAPLPNGRGELRRYQLLWGSIVRFIETGDEVDLARVRHEAARLDLIVEPVPESTRTAFVLRERHELRDKHGWDTALLFPRALGPVLQVPRPASGGAAAEAASVLCERVDCRAIIVSGVDTGGGRGDALTDSLTPLARANTVLLRHDRVLLLADPEIAPGEAVLHRPEPRVSDERLWPGVRRDALPPSRDVVAWGPPELGVLRANPDTLVELVIAGTPLPTVPITDEALLSAVTPRRAADERGAPSEAELLVLSRQIASPLLAADRDPDRRERQVRWATAMASLLQLEVRPVCAATARAEEGCDPDGWLIADRERARGRLGAGAVLRMRGAPIAFEVPNPTRERGTLPLALELARTTGARALLFADPPARRGASALHPASAGELETAFHAIHQAIHRALPADEGLVLQVRGFSARPAVGAELLVDLEGPVLQAAQRPPVLTALLSPDGPLGWLGAEVRYHDGAPELVGLADVSAQQHFARTFGGAQLASLWFSDRLRGAYIAPRDLDAHLALGGLEVAPSGANLHGWLIGGLGPATGTSRALDRRFARLQRRIDRYLRQQSVHELRVLAREAAREPGVALLVRQSAAHGLTSLSLEVREGRRVKRGVFFLQQQRAAAEPVTLSAEPGHADEVARALRQRRAVVVTGEPVREARR